MNSVARSLFIGQDAGDDAFIGLYGGESFDVNDFYGQLTKFGSLFSPFRAALRSLHCSLFLEAERKTVRIPSSALRAGADIVAVVLVHRRPTPRHRFTSLWQRTAVHQLGSEAQLRGSSSVLFSSLFFPR